MSCKFSVIIVIESMKRITVLDFQFLTSKPTNVIQICLVYYEDEKVWPIFWLVLYIKTVNVGRT